MNNRMRLLLAALFLGLAVVLIITLFSSGGDRFISPYENVDWQTTHYYHVNLHTHTTLSDGRYDPHQAIDMYDDLDYDILSLTDHDTHHAEQRPQTLYPWTMLNDIYHELKDQIKSGTITFGDNANEEWQNRDPVELDMLSVEGSEMSRTHHIGSYMSDYAEGEGDEETVFQEIAERDGITMFFHPGRYDHEPEWYVDFFSRHPHLVGMEIYNQVDRYPVDRVKWDRILYRMMPERPVWGFANDDTHRTEHFGANRNIFLLPDKSLENVREAMLRGHIYLFVPEVLGDRPDVQITNIESTGNRIALTVDGVSNEVQWITHDPATDDSHSIHSGMEIALEEVPEEANFVRAVILSDGGRTYTQPFGIQRAE
ncbi:MAG: hypothetical protein WD266_03670 [Balneolales bacterium]